MIFYLFIYAYGVAARPRTVSENPTEDTVNDISISICNSPTPQPLLLFRNLKHSQRHTNMNDIS